MFLTLMSDLMVKIFDGKLFHIDTAIELIS